MSTSTSGTCIEPDEVQCWNCGQVIKKSKRRCWCGILLHVEGGMKLKFKAHVEGVIPTRKDANVISNPGIELYVYPESMQTDVLGLQTGVERDDESVINKLLYRLLDSRLPLTVTIEVG